MTLATVHSMTRAGRDVVLIELHPTHDGAFPPATAGAHIDLHLGPVIRQYSLLGDPRDTARWLIAVKREEDGRGGSEVIHTQLRVGHTVEVTGPRNHFELQHPTGGAGRTILLAGGIGATPLTAMAEQCAATGREFTLHCYASDADGLPLRDHLVARPWSPNIVEHLSNDGESLRSTDTLPQSYADGDDLYICGPAGFISRALELAESGRWPADAVHVERFAPTEQPDLTGDAFTVTVASTGASYPVAEHDTIAEVLAAHGVAVELSCEQGICGACLTGVVDGVPDHRDEVQSPDEHAANTQVTLCCSRSRTANLTLAL
ncbi:PDR/VanB family oxidoreductase [Corynebacterium glyciniphilum]|uniref:PDR/VanB family oxidoreductase n=1 Tax=Corynebacterium glyciniphilum TaxID=1404244 RepID=UPI003DA19FAB